jgi:hypothetical protein
VQVPTGLCFLALERADSPVDLALTIDSRYMLTCIAGWTSSQGRKRSAQRRLSLAPKCEQMPCVPAAVPQWFVGVLLVAVVDCLLQVVLVLTWSEAVWTPPSHVLVRQREHVIRPLGRGRPECLDTVSKHLLIAIQFD